MGAEFTPEQFRGYLRVLAHTLLQTAGPVRTKLDASDLVQETLLKAHTALDQFRGATPGEFAAWLRRILANRFVDVARHFGRHKRDVGLEQRYRETLDQSASNLERLVVVEQPTPADQVLRFERISRLAAALDALPEDQRTALELHHLVGLGVGEIATQMQRSSASVAGLLRRGLKKLREILAEVESL
jgi:RNA polymerase sigma-70 factor (ECF subfamily)